MHGESDKRKTEDFNVYEEEQIHRGLNLNKDQILDDTIKGLELTFGNVMRYKPLNGKDVSNTTQYSKTYKINYNNIENYAYYRQEKKNYIQNFNTYSFVDVRLRVPIKTLEKYTFTINLGIQKPIISDFKLIHINKNQNNKPYERIGLYYTFRFMLGYEYPEDTDKRHKRDDQLRSYKPNNNPPFLLSELKMVNMRSLSVSYLYGMYDKSYLFDLTNPIENGSSITKLNDFIDNVDTKS